MTLYAGWAQNGQLSPGRMGSLALYPGKAGGLMQSEHSGEHIPLHMAGLKTRGLAQTTFLLNMRLQCYAGLAVMHGDSLYCRHAP